MANLNALARKLQTAILAAGGMVKLNTRQFYSEEQGRMVTVNIISVPEWSERARKMVDREKLATCSMAQVVQYLAAMLEALRSEAES